VRLIRQDLELPADWGLLLAHGGLEAMYAADRALFGPGDEVLTTDPGFLPLHAQVRLGGARPVELPIYAPPWKLTVERVREAIGPRTRGVLLVDPINPLGTGYTEQEVRAIAEVCRDEGLLLVHDVTYRDFSAHRALAHAWHPEGTLLLYSFSKGCGLAGLRIGALAAPRRLWERIKPFAVSTLGVNVLGQVAAKAALASRAEWLPRVLETCRRNQRRIAQAVHATPGCSVPVLPSQANVLVVDVGGAGLDPEELEARLLLEHKVFVRAGKHLSPRFGDRFVRVSFSAPEEDVARFAAAWAEVVPRLGGRK
jgi:aspartate/methionine/tyrosine aminotransferase